MSKYSIRSIDLIMYVVQLDGSMTMRNHCPKSKSNQIIFLKWDMRNWNQLENFDKVILIRNCLAVVTQFQHTENQNALSFILFFFLCGVVIIKNIIRWQVTLWYLGFYVRDVKNITLIMESNEFVTLYFLCIIRTFIFIIVDSALSFVRSFACAWWRFESWTHRF